MSEKIAGRMRNNLKRDYGIKVFHIGKPLLAIRIPKKDISQFDPQDIEAITEQIQQYSDQIRLDELVHAYVLADRSYVILDPQDVINVVFEHEVPVKPDIKKSGTAIEEVTLSEISDVPETTDSEKTDETVVLNILSDFAKRKRKKLSLGQLKSGRRAEVLTKGKRGRYVRHRIPDGKVNDIAIAPTIRAASIHAKDGRIQVKKSDYREKVRRRRIATLIDIVLDTSGSMDEIDKVDITRSVIVALLKDAYQRRDKVSMVSYSGRKAETVLPFTSSVERAKRYLENIPFGGTTPLASGILTGLHGLHNEIKKDPSNIPIMILVTDGKANVPLEVGGNIHRELMVVLKYLVNEGIHVLVVDMSSEGSYLAREISEKSGGRYYHPEHLSKENLYKIISNERDDVSYFAKVE
ncbi:MAG: VWA domain-containing protein [Methanosarcinales archaeon]|nr:VWA domain-containing protein [Methanosarcinales archaeon]